MNKDNYLLRFDNGRFLASFTTDENVELDDIMMTPHQNKAMRFSMEEALEVKTNYFKAFKVDIVEYGTLIIHIPTKEEYRLLNQRKLENSTNDELCDEIISRLETEITVCEVREKLEFCFGRETPLIYYKDSGIEVSIEKVFESLKYGGKIFINGLTQYKWHSHDSIEVIELVKRKGLLFLHKRYVLDFKYNTPLEMLTDKNVKFPTTGYKEGVICEEIYFGNSRDYIEHKIKHDKPLVYTSYYPSRI